MKPEIRRVKPVGSPSSFPSAGMEGVHLWACNNLFIGFFDVTLAVNTLEVLNPDAENGFHVLDPANQEAASARSSCDNLLALTQDD